MDILTLAGIWQLALGAPAAPSPQTALPAVTYTDTIELPGTTETRGKGPANAAADRGSLTRVHKFDGVAWYRREIDIPADWADRRVELYLERSKITQVWLDDRPLGEQAFYATPQVYDLTGYATPGTHTLTIAVDNRHERRPVQAEAHQFSDNTQTNWNGLLGRLELISTPRVWLSDVQLTPDVAARAFRVRAVVGNQTGALANGTVSARAHSWNHPGATVTAPPSRETVKAGGDGETVVELVYPLGPDAPLWDEFSPALFEVTLTLDTPAGRHERTITAGLREFRTRDGQFTINGRSTFLRGKHDACVFPLTGHPPMDVDGWVAYFRTLKAYGLNHVRCHTWTPPEAAFAAADRVGIYFQPELYFWGTFDAKVRDWLMPEAERILRMYGNHASFVMFTLGNEIGGDRGLMNAMVTHLRALDSRRLYADGCNNWLWEPRLQPTNDFFVSAKSIPPGTDQQFPVRGSFCVFDDDRRTTGHVLWGAAETRTDLSAGIVGMPVPVVGHETGQFTIYPDFREIADYTGVTEARNLARFRQRLTAKGMLDQAPAFHAASGALAGQLYREENELALRTPGFGGFQLLDLQDFPGQGTALVGILDAFMRSKGVISREEWRRSCGPIVPLARFDRYAWTTSQTYVAELQVAHYGASDLAGAVTRWEIRDDSGAVVRKGAFAAADVPQGGLRPLGRVELPLAALPAPARYTLEVTLAASGDTHVNDWPLWVYPDAADTAVPDGVTVVRTFDEHARARLAAGERLVLIPGSNNWADTVPGGYATDFWNWPMFNGTPGTMGFLIDARHPALAQFPARSHTERQWHAIAHASMPVILTDAPSTLRPIVQVIDNYERNEKLGLVFETAVGPGRLLVCAVDLYALADRDPAARQLMASLLAYAGSNAFAPAATVPPEFLTRVLRPALSRGATVTAEYQRPPWGSQPTPDQALDGDVNTKWVAKTSDAAPTFAVDLGRNQLVDTLELLWEHDEPGYRYLIEGSVDGAAWITLADQRNNAFPDGRHWVRIDPATVRQVRLTISGAPPGQRISLRELRVLGR